jgi:hypothetical protein
MGHLDESRIGNIKVVIRLRHAILRHRCAA